MSIERVIEISAPVATVWRVWTDVDDWPTWNSAVTQVVRLGGEAPGTPIGPGSRARLRQPQLPAAIWEVTEWEPQRRWAWATRQPGATTTGLHVVEDLGGGRCRVTARATHEGALAGLVRLVAGRLSARLVDREVADLRRRCEGRPPPAGPKSPEGFRH